MKVLQWGNDLRAKAINPEEIITIILQKSTAGADDTIEAGKALGEGDTVRAGAHIYTAAKLALTGTDANFTASVY